MSHSKDSYRAWLAMLKDRVRVCNIQGCNDFIHNNGGANHRFCLKHQSARSRKNKRLKPGPTPRKET